MNFSNDNLITVYDAFINKYEGEVKGFQIMMRREELSGLSEATKKHNIGIWKQALRRARWNLTRAKNLRKQSL
jgi:hypothetical protein